MSGTEEPASRFGTRALAVAAVVILLPLAYSVLDGVFGGDDRGEQPFLARPAPQYESCVRDVEYMRFHHWELLNEIREAVVRHGERGEVNLASCRGCHPDRARFCNECHAAASLRLDCWGCHYYPETPEDRPATTARSAVAGAARLAVR